ncbi:MAG: hypothetical protein Q7R61_02080 [bacterium]|nr:hypothetical protein [bacterium]
MNKKEYYLAVASIALLAVIAAYAWFSPAETKILESNQAISPDSIELPIIWGNLGARMISAGVIDRAKLEAIYAQRGGLTDEEKQILEGETGKLKITQKNSGFILNMLWALGIGNKNEILEKGPMMTYGGADSPAEALAKAGNFASTGGWTLAKGGAMEHYSKHSFITLTQAQQLLVEEVSKNIYRPCCDNPTYFPDCNHGMAMLGLLELMASQGVSESDMYKIALAVNSYWFPDTYLTIAKYLKEKKNISWVDANPKEILGRNYSSGSGYQNILSQVAPPINNKGQGCGI